MGKWSIFDRIRVKQLDGYVPVLLFYNTNIHFLVPFSRDSSLHCVLCSKTLVEQGEKLAAGTAVTVL